MFLLDRSNIKHNTYGLTVKDDSALYYCLSNLIAIPDKFTAELNFWKGYEGVHRDSHPVIAVLFKLRDSGHHSGSIGEDNAQVINTKM